MTLSKDLFLSILSMDSYNRGYIPGISGLGGIDAQIGSATIKKESDIAAGIPGVDASFYAVSYTLTASVGVSGDTIASGTTIISYRGTDELDEELLQVDLPVSFFGSYDQRQIALAQQFFKSVASAPGTGPLLLTGHSLGGALAGITGALNGTNSVLVDHIGFQTSLENLVTGWNEVKDYLSLSSSDEILPKYALDNGIIWQPGDIPPMGYVGYAKLVNQWDFFKSIDYNGSEALDINTIQNFLGNSQYSNSFYLSGSVTETTRGTSEPISTPTLQSYIGDLTNYLANTIPLFPDQEIIAHSASLNVILKYAEQESTSSAILQFKPVLADALAALLNNDIAAKAGFQPKNTGGIYSAYEKMIAAIAYSAIDEGVRVFGDTGIRAFFNDLSALGSKVNVNSTFLQDTDKALFGSDVGNDTLRLSVVEALTQFAGQLAFRKVEMTDADADNAIEGIIYFANGGTISSGLSQAGADTMFIDLSPMTWRTGLASSTTPSNLPDLLTNWLETMLVSQLASHQVGGVGPDAQPFDTLALPEADLLGMFEMVYDQPDEGRGWSDPRSPGQYLNGVAFIDPNATGLVTIADFQTVLGTISGNAAVMVVATEAADNIQGSIKNEVILSGFGNDTIHGGDGSDIIVSGVGNDSVFGEAGDDLLIGDIFEFDGAPIGGLPDSDFKGNDMLDMGTGFDTAIGGAGDDTIRGDSNINASVDKSHGHSDIHAGEGNDSVDAGDGADLIFDNGATLPWAFADAEEALEVYSNAYDGLGNDTLHGGKGSDILVSSGGNDSLYGGLGDDTYLVTGRAALSTLTTDKVEIHVADTPAEGLSGFGHDFIAGNGQGSIDLSLTELTAPT